MNNLQYPLLYFINDSFYPKNTEDEFLIVNKTLAKSKRNIGMKIVDWGGRLFTVESVTLQGKARWSWHDLFLNPLVRISLTFTGTPTPITAQEVRTMIYGAKIRWHGIESRGDFPQLKRHIQKATTVQDLISLFL